MLSCGLCKTMILNNNAKGLRIIESPRSEHLCPHVWTTKKSEPFSERPFAARMLLDFGNKNYGIRRLSFRKSQLRVTAIAGRTNAAFPLSLFGIFFSQEIFELFDFSVKDHEINNEASQHDQNDTNHHINFAFGAHSVGHLHVSLAIG
jgi:hypothetical protein